MRNKHQGGKNGEFTAKDSLTIIHLTDVWERNHGEENFTFCKIVEG
jgi:hypothetical protein